MGSDEKESLMRLFTSQTAPDRIAAIQRGLDNLTNQYLTAIDNLAAQLDQLVNEETNIHLKSPRKIENKPRK